MSHFDTKEEHHHHLYLMELIVERLELTPDKIHECGDSSLLLKIKFLALPIFVISPSDFESVNSHNETSDGSLVLSSGRSCLFGKRPRDLVREMQTTPLRIGVFCVGDTYPIAELTLPLTGCLCDQIAMAMNDQNHLPEPYVIHGRHGLFDPGKNPSGYLTLELKITCLGKHVTTRYQMKGNSFVFKSDRDEGQYFVKRVVSSIDASGDQQEGQKLDGEVAENHLEPLQVKQQEDDEVPGEDQQQETKEKKKIKKKKKKKK